jgi:hypothetical protein
MWFAVNICARFAFTIPCPAVVIPRDGFKQPGLGMLQQLLLLDTSLICCSAADVCILSAHDGFVESGVCYHNSRSSSAGGSSSSRCGSSALLVSKV